MRGCEGLASFGEWPVTLSSPLSPHHHHFLMEKSASLLPFLFSLLPGIHSGFPEPSPAPLDDPGVWGWTQASALATGGGGPLSMVLPREQCSQESRRMWWSSHHSESLPCTFRSRPACNDLLHPEGCCPVSNPYKMGQNHMVNASLIPI